MSAALQNICILGSTGSIGVSTLDVIALHPDKYRIESLTAHSNVDLLFEQIKRFKPDRVVVVDELAGSALRERLANESQGKVELLTGVQNLEQVASSETVDTVMAAIVGAAGLLPTLAAVKAGKKVLLANKEALVCSGQIFIDAMQVSGAQLIPVDSEHNAIFQCLPFNEQARPGFCQLKQNGISKILLTGSGGPFRAKPLPDFEAITPDEACAHPNWDMGRKISVDSATMMNKGLEFIEAKWLFNVSADDIEVIIHPQSTIHSMVQYTDGSVLAQMGNPDMRTPIAHALAYPKRIESGVASLDFLKASAFEFQEVDFDRYPNLQLAIEACRAGQGACTALNAANEVSVAAFLDEKIKFTQIAQINETSLQKFVSEKVENIDDVILLDQQVRAFAMQLIKTFQAGLTEPGNY
jgi:1-deoxy-D-xylulose-5-phosphate reductoisomerase